MTITTAITEADLVQLIVGMYRDALSDRELDADSDFFEAGGDSMRAIRLVALARERGLHFRAQEVYAGVTRDSCAARSSVTARTVARASRRYESVHCAIPTGGATRTSARERKRALAS